MKTSRIISSVAVCILSWGFGAVSAQDRVDTNDLRLVDATQPSEIRVVTPGQTVILDEHAAEVGRVESISRNGQVIARRVVDADYKIIGSGLYYRDAQGKLQPSEMTSRERQSSDDPVVFDKLPVELIFAPDINQASSAEFARNGVVSKSGIAGIQYIDRNTGEERLVAWVKSSPVQEISDGVAYEDAFAGAVADVRYVISQNKIQQDVVLYALPDPALFDMALESTDLRVLTEIIDVDPAEMTVVRSGEFLKSDTCAAPIQLHRDGVVSDRLFNLQRGYAYPEGEGWAIGGKGSGHRHLLKMRIVDMNGRAFLAEEIPLASIQAALPKLFVREGGFILDQEKTVSVPPARPIKNEGAELAGVDVYRSRPGFVVDYINWSSTVTNSFTLEANDTYLVSTDLAIDGTNVVLTIEPGAVVKLTEGSSISIINGAAVKSYGYLHNPAIFTSADDETVGQIIPGYGYEAPESNKYEAAFIFAESNNLEGVRIRYAELGVEFQDEGTLKHSIIEDSSDGVELTAITTTFGLNARNVLFRNLERGITVDALTNWIYQVFLDVSTLDNISDYALSCVNTAHYYYVRSSLFASITNTVIHTNVNAAMAYNGVYNTSTQGFGANVTIVTNSPFQSGTYGDYYLDQSSALIDHGFAVPALFQLSEYSTSTNHQEDTGVTDIGFHYPGTNDVDGDGLLDIREAMYGASSTNADSDADGLLDGEEVDTYRTDPTDSDTDGDGDSDGAEVDGGSDPLDVSSFLTSISGSISYSGGQTGLIHVTARTDPGLALYFNFDTDSGTNVIDQSGLTNNGAMFDGATWTSNGYSGGAIYFQGTGAYIRVPYSSTYDLTQFTASAWVKLNESELSDYRGVLSRHRSFYDTDSWRLGTHTYDSSFLPQMWGNYGSRGEVMVSADAVEEQWGFVTMTFDGTTLKFYTNAGFAGSSQITGYSPNSYDLLIGAQEYNSGNIPYQFWKGWIDEVKIHDRALNPIEVSRLYTTGSTITNSHVATISDPGAYTITNVPTKLRYHLDAWRDSDGDGETDATEAQGIYSGNLLELTAAETNANITLTEIDTDEDGIPDWWEIQYGFNPSSGVSDSMVGWWKFDESSGTNADNSASTGYDGQLVNMSTSSWVSGKLGNAIELDGSDDYVRVPQSPVLITSTQFTASGWAYLASTSNDDYPSIISDLDPCSGAYKGFWLGWDSYVPGIGTLVGSCTGSFAYAYYAAPITGQWVHIASICDGTTTRLYRDGVEVSSDVQNFAPAHQSEIRIGWANDSCCGYYWEGELDDVRLYTSALSSNDMYTMYDALQDPDGDGFTNLEEYNAGTSPTWSNPPPVVVITYPQDQSLIP